MIIESNGYERTCRRCGNLVLIQDMETRNCKSCMNTWREYLAGTKYRVKEYQRAHHLMQTYGLTVAEYDQMLADQDNKCYICRTAEFGNHRSDKPFVDHDHTTGRVRRLLCNSCNLALGYFKEDIEVMRRAIEYLEGFNVRELMR